MASKTVTRSIHIIITLTLYTTPKLQALVVQKMDSAIHQINHYPVDNAINFRNTYPLDSDLSGGWRYPTFEQLGPGVYISRNISKRTVIFELQAQSTNQSAEYGRCTREFVF